jgi:hypothetical protein
MRIPTITATTATLPLESGLFSLPFDDRDSRIIARHYGLDGRGGANFQRIGDEFGLTRERVRQIVSQTDPLRYIKPGALTTLTRIISSITSTLPAPAASLEMGLRAEGLTLDLFRLEGILEIAALLGCPAPFQVRHLNGTRYAVVGNCRPFQNIVTRARQMVRRNGMATLAACVSGSSRKSPTQGELELAEAVLLAESDFRWLLAGSGWFWFSDTQNRAASRIKKMLAVANPLTITEIRGGLTRMDEPLAPKKVLLDLCRQLPGLSVHGETVRADAEIKVGEVLNKTEREIFRLLSEHNGCMSNSELICRSLVLGMKRPTFYQCVTHSPIIARYNQSYYRLIGSHFQDDVCLRGSRSRQTPTHASGGTAVY